MRFNGSIEKTYKDDQGHLIVCGHASTEALDSQGEIVTKEAMGAALTDYMQFANVREMHQPSAVGKTLLAEQDEKGTYIEVKVVDPVAALKCEEGVYSGFSIGGKASKRDPVAKNTITGLRLTEISLVDRPANPEAVFTMFKLDDELDEVEKIAYADPKNEKYPIDTVEHIRAAWSYINMPKNAAKETDVKAIKARIIAAWKQKIDPKGPPSAEKGDTAMDVKKGMQHVAQLAMILKELGYFVDDQVEESAREGDASPMPGKLLGWLKEGAALLQGMTEEETAELVAAAQADQLDDPAAPAGITMAEATDGLQKKGAVFSQATRDKFKNLLDGFIAVQNTLKENLDQFSSFAFPDITSDLEPEQANMVANPNVYAQPEGERGTAGTPMGAPDTSINSTTAAPVAPVLGPHGANGGNKGGVGIGAVKADEETDIQKANADSLEKITSLTSDLEKAAATIDTLSKRVSELEAMPAPPKAKLLEISKAQDVVVSDPVISKADELKKSSNPVDVMKGVLMSGARRGYPM